MSSTPQTAVKYRLWWESRTTVPFGYCWCGCGERTKPAPKTHAASNHVAGEPVRYVYTHHISPIRRERDEAIRVARVAQYRLWWKQNASVPYGYCWCGCGNKTNPAAKSKETTPKGEPVRFMYTHQIAKGSPLRTRDVTVSRSERYRADWKRERPKIPYGYCWCGCGERTSIATTTQGKRGLVRGEPVRYLKGHAARERANARYPNQKEPNPSGLCMCGCGKKTSIAPYTSRKNNVTKGKPVRFRPGHGRTAALRDELDRIQDPNPSGLCMCGCGGETAVIARNHLPSGKKSGHHNRFIQDHYNKKRVETYFEQSGHLDTPCWIWQGKTNENGYGLTQRSGKTRLAHRMIYQDYVGAVPDGLVLDHLCNQRACVNPDHLEAVTQGVNSSAGRTSNVSRVTSRAATALHEAGFSVEEISIALHMRKGVVSSLLA